MSSFQGVGTEGSTVYKYFTTDHANVQDEVLEEVPEMFLCEGFLVIDLSVNVTVVEEPDVCILYLNTTRRQKEISLYIADLVLALKDDWSGIFAHSACGKFSCDHAHLSDHTHFL